MLEQLHHRFGPFLLLRTLGRGGMGEVFIARAPWAEHPLVAVKRLRPDVALVPTFAERFQHEAEICVRLEHPSIVSTLDVGSVEGQLYVASELLLGKDTGLIADRLRQRGQGGPAAVAIRVLADALAGLSYVHGAQEPDGTNLGLVHRDMTPGNLLIGYSGATKLADFGLAKSLLSQGSNLTRHGEILGTPHYLAPELVKGESAKPVSDIYGLGGVLYRFLTGVAPHQGTTAEILMKVLSEEPRHLSSLRPDLPEWFITFIHDMLHKDPLVRPNDASMLLSALKEKARAGSLWVSHSAVGKWLSNLFEEEHREELVEHERLLQVEVEEDFGRESEGTVVLARPSQASGRLEAPSAMRQSEEAAEYDFSDQETLNGSTEFVAPLPPSSRLLDDAQDTRALLLDALPPASASASSSSLSSSSSSSSSSLLKVHPSEIADPDLEEMETKYGSIVPPLKKPGLPGFAQDVDQRLAVEMTANEAEPGLRQRPLSPDSVVVRPLSSLSSKASSARPALNGHPSPSSAARPLEWEGVPGVSSRQSSRDARAEKLSRPSPAVENRPSGVENRYRTDMADVPAKDVLVQRSRSEAVRAPSSSLLILVLLVVLAIAVGVGIGILVASFKLKGQDPTAPVAPALTTHR